jgi:hypothetical protein
MEATIVYDGVEIELDQEFRFLPWYVYSAFCPPGKAFTATGGHVLGAVGNKAAVRKAIKDGGGIEGCTINECDYCEDV